MFYKSETVGPPAWICTTNTTCGSFLQHVFFKKHTREHKRGGTQFPIALIQHIMVTLTPRSADVILPTCFIPLAAITRTGVWTVDSPVSFKLCFLSRVNLYQIICFSSLSKNMFTFVLLKAEDLARPVRCLRKKYLYHSLLALWFCIIIREFFQFYSWQSVVHFWTCTQIINYFTFLMVVKN